MQSQTNPSSLEPLVDKLAYRVKLSAEDRAAILALPYGIKAVERGQLLVRERDQAICSYVMLSGYSIRFKTSAQGDRQIVAIHMKGEAVDLQNSMLEVADHSVQMLTSGKVATIARDDIIRLTRERPTVAHAMWIDTLVDGSIFREWIMNVGRRDARTRMAHILCEFAVRMRVAGLGQDSQYELPMSQEQLADATGMTPVHVNRTLKGLEKERLIDRPNPRAVCIGDWRKLAEVGDFDTNYLHLREHDSPFL